MKKLTLDKIYVFAIARSIGSVPTHLYANPDEMMKTYKEDSGVLATLATDKDVKKLIDLTEQVNDLRGDMNAEQGMEDDVTKKQDIQKAYGEKINSIIAKMQKIENDVKDKMAVISFEDDVFNLFFQQFERWALGVKDGRGNFQLAPIFNMPKEYMKVRKAVNEANQQKKDK